MACRVAGITERAMTMKNTPTPWTANNVTLLYLTDSKADEITVTVIEDANGGVVAYVPHDRDHDENAAVLKAAPALRTALESLFEHCAMPHKHWGEGCNRREADAAIAAGRAALTLATVEEQVVWTTEYRREAGGWEVMQGAAHRGVFDSEEAAHEFIASMS